MRLCQRRSRGIQHHQHALQAYVHVIKLLMQFKRSTDSNAAESTIKWSTTTYYTESTHSIRAFQVPSTSVRELMNNFINFELLSQLRTENAGNWKALDKRISNMRHARVSGLSRILSLSRAQAWAQEGISPYSPSLECHLEDEEAQEVHGEAAELVMLDQLVQVDAEQLEHQAQVAAVHEEVTHAHNVVLVVRVPPGVQELQDPHLHASLHWHACASVSVYQKHMSLQQTHICFPSS